MTPSTIQGYAATAVGQPLRPFACEPPRLGEHDVRIAVTHCGVCYTDIQAIDDYYDITTYPFFPGHEIVGHVAEVGRAVSGLKEGDRVGVGWQGRSCGHCDWCLQGEEQLCQEIVAAATWLPYGGFSPSVIVDCGFAYPMPQAMRSDVGAVLMCAGITAYAALKSYRGPSAQRIGIVGVGGIGHLALQYARALGYEVTAISRSVEKQDEALAMGAHHFVASSDRGALRKMNYGFDLLLCTAHGDLTWDPLVMTLKKRGRMILAGFPNIALNSTDIVAHEVSITGSFLGNHGMMREMLAFSQAHAIAPRIELMPMSQVNEALDKVRENKAHYRIVLTNNASGA